MVERVKVDPFANPHNSPIRLCDLEKLPRALSLGTCSKSPFSHHESTIDARTCERSEYGDIEWNKGEKMIKD